MKVAYLGPKGTFSHEACNIYFKTEELFGYKTITDTILALKNGIVEKCIVPIENSLQGSVTETIDMLIENNDVNVIDEFVLEIKQCLMAKENYELSDIKEVYSHYQALSQCRNYINTNLYDVDIKTVSSTAIAAQEVSQKDNCACIGNKNCLEEYNLKLLKENIQDNNYNKTRFWILDKRLIMKNEYSKMSIVFSIKDKPGELYRFLKIFEKYEINLTKIESRPAKTVLGEYIFIIDLEVCNENIEKAINEIKMQGLYYRILGKY